MDRLESYRCNVLRPSGDVPVGDANNLRGTRVNTSVGDTFEENVLPTILTGICINSYKDNSPASSTFIKEQNIPASGVYYPNKGQNYPSLVIMEGTFGNNNVMETCYIDDGVVVIC